MIRDLILFFFFWFCFVIKRFSSQPLKFAIVSYLRDNFSLKFLSWELPREKCEICLHQRYTGRIWERCRAERSAALSLKRGPYFGFPAVDKNQFCFASHGRNLFCAGITGSRFDGGNKFSQYHYFSVSTIYDWVDIRVRALYTCVRACVHAFVTCCVHASVNL